MIKHFLVRIEELPEGGFLATSEDLPDLIAYAVSVPEAIEIAKDVAQKLVESYIEHNGELPLSIRAEGTHHRELIQVSVADG